METRQFVFTYSVNKNHHFYTHWRKKERLSLDILLKLFPVVQMGLREAGIPC